jgi:hypothetical protein
MSTTDPNNAPANPDVSATPNTPSLAASVVLAEGLCPALEQLLSDEIERYNALITTRKSDKDRIEALLYTPDAYANLEWPYTDELLNALFATSKRLIENEVVREILTELLEKFRHNVATDDDLIEYVAWCMEGRPVAKQAIDVRWEPQMKECGCGFVDWANP